MRVALCMSGGLRCFKDTAGHFKKFVQSRLDCDLFMYGAENKDGAASNITDFKSLYNPVVCQINSIESYNTLLYSTFNVNELQPKAGDIRLKNMIPMFYNIWQCNQLRKQYELDHHIKYDVIVRLRPDAFFMREINSEELQQAINGDLLIPDPWNFCGGITDIFAIANPNVMDIYSDIFNSLSECFANNLFHPESITRYHLEKNKVPIKIVTRHHEMEYPESLDLNDPSSLIWDRSKGRERNLKYSFDKNPWPR